MISAPCIFFSLKCIYSNLYSYLQQKDLVWRTVIDSEELEKILSKIKDGTLGVDEGLEKLRVLPFQDIGFAKIDHHRDLRTGFPEVIYAPGKTIEQINEVAIEMFKTTSRVMITRASSEVYENIERLIPSAKYNTLSRSIILDKSSSKKGMPGVTVMAAGTSDLPIAEEAAVTAEVMGCEVQRLWDVGIAGLQRLLSNMDLIQKSKVIVAVAGMEGALPSVVAGLVSAPVIAVPTSVGYGANFGGLTALLAMLNACSPGIAVVNIDNGFGAGYMAATINLSINTNSTERLNE